MKKIIGTILLVLLTVALCSCQTAEPILSSPTAEPQTTIPQAANTPAQIVEPNPSAPADTGIPEWWGEYIKDDLGYSLEINNFNGQSFNFAIERLSDGMILWDGVAPLDPGDNMSAEYEGMSFTLAEDFSSVYVSVPPDVDAEYLAGFYFRDYSGPGDPGDTNNPYRQDGPAEIDPANQSDPGDTNNPYRQSDPGDADLPVSQGDPAEVPEWWGTFAGEIYSIGFANFNGESLNFEVFDQSSGETILTGLATLYPDNSQMAEFGAISFYLDDDFSAVDLFASESSEYAYLRGRYYRQ